MVPYMLGEELGYYPDPSRRLKYDIVVASRLQFLKFPKLREDRAAPDSLVLDAVGGEIGDDIRCRLEGMAGAPGAATQFVY